MQRWIDEGRLAGTVRPDVESSLAAELFCSTVDGLIYRWLVNPDIAVRELHDLLKREVARAFAVTRTH